MTFRIRTLLAVTMLVCSAAPAASQTWAVDDPVLKQIWKLGMEESQAERIAQPLLDSIGPRLTGSPAMKAANDWAVALLQSWGIEARNEQYGTWRGWRRGITHIDLIAPRVRTLEGTMLAWSPGTNGKKVEAPVVVPPVPGDTSELAAWLKTVRGKFVAISFPQPTCRPDAHYEEYGTPGALQRLQNARREAEEAFRRSVPQSRDFHLRLEEAGVAGILTSNWSRDLGVNKVFFTETKRTPVLDLSCEDYGLVYRLAQNGQGPVVRLEADAEFLGEVPVYNTIGVIRGTELPNEYVLLSAHFDSWDSSSGATDNGTGVTTMLEAMRILKQAYPRPKRTIMVALWGGEEQGLNGSRRFAAMHPEIVEGLQALFNQDNGTGRVVNISMQGLVDAGAHFGRWLARIPVEITRHIELQIPGAPGGGGSDYASFICAGAPAFSLSSLSWGYGTVTWHTNRDTYDKIVFEEIRNNATLTAMLAYLASEDPERVSRARRVLPPAQAASQGPGRPGGFVPSEWPACRPGAERFGS